MIEFAHPLPHAATYSGAPAAVVTSGTLAKTTAAATMPAFSKPAQLPRNLITFRKDVVLNEFHGAGGALTDLSAWSIMQVPPIVRTALLKDMFVTKAFSFVRIAMGSTDFNAYGNSIGDMVYTYTDNGGVADPTLTTFSIARDTAYIIPCLLEILALNPRVRIIFEPFTVPTWLKSGAAFIGNATNYATWGKLLCVGDSGLSSPWLNNIRCACAK